VHVSRGTCGQICLCAEAVGIFAGSDDFLCINDKEPILQQVILVSEAPLRPSEALVRGRPKTPLSRSYNGSEFSDSLVPERASPAFSYQPQHEQAGIDVPLPRLC
jgi:hypothetical protein